MSKPTTSETDLMTLEVMSETGHEPATCLQVVTEYLEGREAEELSQTERELVVENSIANLNSGTR